jgi:cytochrome c biogenesis protein
VAQLSTPAVPARRLRRSLPDLVVDRIWRFFCSVRAAICEIAILALLVLIGTLRGSSVPQGIADTVPALAPLVERWYAWDVFHSLPFMAILTLLSVAIAIGGMINRAPGIWQAIAHPTVPTTHGFLRNAETSARVAASVSPTELATRLTAALRAGRYRVLAEERNGEVHLYADRNRFAKLGTFPFHLALILILVGGIVGARWGFREQIFVVPEGSVRELGHGTGLSVRLDNFVDSYYENGQPEKYRSDLTLFENGEEVKRGTATVNHPLSHGATVFYQSSFGQAVDLRITDREGRVLWDDAAPLEFRSSLNADAAAAVIELPPANLKLHVIAPDENPRNAPEADTLNLASGSMYFLARPLGPDSPIETPAGVVGRLGETSQLVGLNIDFERERRYTLLQVGRNPGIPIFVVASLLLVGGLAVTFYFPHRRVRGIVAAAPGGGSTATLAPLARRDWSAQRAFERLTEEIERRVGVAVERRQRVAEAEAPVASAGAEARG